jgi:biotin carboxyl carrier protein
MADRRNRVKMEFEFLVNNELHKIILEKKENVFIFSDGKNSFEADVHSISPNSISVLIGEQSHLIFIARDRDKKYIYLDGQQFVLQEPQMEVKSFQKAEDKTQEGKLLITAPMPGKVIKISVAEAEEVRKNQTLAIVEAMKMENEIKSSIEGYVKKIFVAAGELVDSEKPLIELETKKQKSSGRIQE